MDPLKWRNFKSEPPAISDTENMIIIAATKGMEPGELYVDIAQYDSHSGKYERDYFTHSPIEWWRPVGPLLKREDENEEIK